MVGLKLPNGKTLALYKKLKALWLIGDFDQTGYIIVFIAMACKVTKSIFL